MPTPPKRGENKGVESSRHRAEGSRKGGTRRKGEAKEGDEKRRTEKGGAVPFEGFETLSITCLTEEVRTSRQGLNKELISGPGKRGDKGALLLKELFEGELYGGEGGGGERIQRLLEDFSLHCPIPAAQQQKPGSPAPSTSTHAPQPCLSLLPSPDRAACLPPHAPSLISRLLVVVLIALS
ncbi:unnamed protein product [Boreogadus saida]